MDPEDIVNDDALLAGVGTTKLFPTLSEPGLSYSFQSTFSTGSSNNDSDSQIEGKTEKKPQPEKKVHRAPPKKKKKKQKVVKSKEYFKKNFFRMKMLAKSLVFENAALHDEITNTEHQLSKAKGERKFLLKRLFHYLPMTETQALQSSAALKSLAANFQGKLPPTVLGPVQPGPQLAAPPPVSTQPPPPKKKKKKKKQPSEGTTDKSAEVTPKNTPQKQSNSGEKSEKPKRKKPGTAMKRKVQSIPVDDAGKPIFPIVLGGLTVNSLGDIVFDRNGFHSERYIWPVGYCSCRAYPSMITPERRVLYTCRIVDGGTEPLFEIVPEDEPDNPVTASTATACHCAILKRLNKARGKETTNTGSGPEFFGFSHPTIQYLIQCLPNTTRLEKFQPVKFELPAKGPVPTMESESQDNSDPMPLAISQSPFFGIKQENSS